MRKVVLIYEVSLPDEVTTTKQDAVAVATRKLENALWRATDSADLLRIFKTQIDPPID